MARACFAWPWWALLWLEVFAPSAGWSNDAYNDYYNDDLFLARAKPRRAEIRDDLPLQDARLLRDTANTTTGSPFEAPTAEADAAAEPWIAEAIKDVAHYLRAHKFNEYDRRYERSGTLAPRTYHFEHPRPPLRSLHWEVHKYCDEAFLVCVRYLWQRAQGADLRRGDDTPVVMQEQRWRMDAAADRARIDIVEAECETLRRRDDILAEPFQGPLERYQWRSTAAYFMCWYTMNEVAHLRHLADDCDNYASCLDKQFGARNGDPRANDAAPFACAMYSFCPDPCCRQRHTGDLHACWNTPKANPCYTAAPPALRECQLDRSQNLDFTSAILNHWNVTCACPLPGYVWDSSYGICVDIDECQRGEHQCDVQAGDACLNTVGAFKCVCKWGHTWSNAAQACEKNEALSQIKLQAMKMLALLEKQQAYDNQHKSYLRRVYQFFKNLLFPKKANSTEPRLAAHNAT